MDVLVTEAGKRIVGKGIVERGDREVDERNVGELFNACAEGFGGFVGYIWDLEAGLVPGKDDEELVWGTWVGKGGVLVRDAGSWVLVLGASRVFIGSW
jgi:hypothetical protein